MNPDVSRRVRSALLVLTLVSAATTRAAESFPVVVKAGASARADTPVRADFPADRLGPGGAKALDDGPRGVWLVGEAGVGKVLGQVEKAGEAARLTFVLPGATPAGAERRFRLDPSKVEAVKSPWAFSDPSAGPLDLSYNGKPVFRYNNAPVSDPNYAPVLARSAYLHPVYTPSGVVATGDFSKAHTHHRGVFLAYTKTRVGDLHPDFWNIQNGTGRVEFDRLDEAVAGPVTARFAARHRWEAKGANGPVLRERWEVEVYDVPGAPYRLFDLTATQQAVDAPVELLPYRYGGMAYRGPDPFLKGPLDVLTSSGLDRASGDQKPARWVDLTGPSAEGSDRYAGLAIFDHPTNGQHPTVARIHPTTLPFFTYTPGHDVKVTIGRDAPTVFRYRLLVHDGRPDAALDDRLWRDFADPPSVTVGLPE